MYHHTRLIYKCINRVRHCITYKAWYTINQQPTSERINQLINKLIGVWSENFGHSNFWILTGVDMLWRLHHLTICPYQPSPLAGLINDTCFGIELMKAQWCFCWSDEPMCLCFEVHLETSVSTLPFINKQCPDCFACLTSTICERGSKWS